MTRVISAESLLNSVIHDLRRMVDEHHDPKNVKKYLKRKAVEIEGNTNYNVVWWKKV